jgi:ribonuclease D
MKHNGQSNHRLPPAQYITTNDGLARLADRLHHESLLAIDTESNSLHVYFNRVCLVQISTRKRDFIIDPLAITEISPLGDLLADPRIEKVFHAAEYDLICLRRSFGFEVQNLFDTMYAARLCGLTSIGLADVLEAHFNVRPDKSHQLDNWALRPLSNASLRYAQMDTHYLPRLRDSLHDRLATRHLLDEAQEVFADVLKVEARDSEFDPEGYWKIGRPSSLTRKQMALLREVYILRDDIARREDKPPFRIMSNNTLVELARHAPHSLHGLNEIRGINEYHVRLYGEELLAALERGHTNPLPAPPQLEMPDPVISERYMTLHAWRKERAAARALDASLILSKQTLWEIAEHLPDSLEKLGALAGIGAWRLQTYGAELLEIVKKMKK